MFFIPAPAGGGPGWGAAQGLPASAKAGGGF